MAALADDIAYNNHDLDDGLRAGLFTLEEVGALPLVGEALAEARAAIPGRAAASAWRPRLIRRVINAMVERRGGRDRAGASPRSRPRSADDIRARGRPGGRLLGRDGRGQPAAARLPVHPHVPPLARQPHHGEVEARRCRCCSSLLHGGPQMLPPMWRARAGDAGLARSARGWCATTSPA